MTPLRSLVTLLVVACSVGQAAVPWNGVLKQPDPWYTSAEARQIAASVLEHQCSEGGWPKNRDMTRPPPAEPLEVDRTLPTIDNGATYTQIRFLARVHRGGEEDRLARSIFRGIDYLLAAQYENGGWPQFYPLRPGYYTHVTFNDDAMVGVLALLQDVATARPPFDFVDEPRRRAAGRAVEKGVSCILRCQISVRGTKTAWCAQHDEHTLAPARARAYEHASLSGLETVGIVRFLMQVDPSTSEIEEAIEAAVTWLKEVQVRGIRLDSVGSDSGDVRVVPDSSAPSLWARFYEIGTNRPIFSGRDGVVRYALSEIEIERRANYRWYTDEPAKLLDRDYPRWRARRGGSGK